MPKMLLNFYIKHLTPIGERSIGYVFIQVVPIQSRKATQLTNNVDTEPRHVTLSSIVRDLSYASKLVMYVLIQSGRSQFQTFSPHMLAAR